ncbi:MAG: GTPase ObgE [Chloroflexi bacterium]|jgi:GTP-binding protein|nr:GTPase ObgE [Chloroflexota bacterium]
MFLDEVHLTVKAGKGGDGMMHFHREKYVTRGGPDGGDGGHGGDVVLAVDPKLNTLSLFHHQRSFQAEDGARGGTNNRTGKTGADMVLGVARGTLVRDAASGQVLGDLTEPGQQLRVARGGRGGRGNPHFASPSNQAPYVAEKGEPGEARELELELKLIADIGLVGVPNAGKSTFLAAATAARPKIAAYPFTTTEPNLGVATLDDAPLVLADIPGLIEGAHRGVGLGFAFLRHIQRTRVLIHLLDGTGESPVADFSQINSELALFDPRLSSKPQVVAFNKMDLPEVQARWEGVRRDLAQRGVELMPLSAATHKGLREVLARAAQLLGDLPPPAPSEGELPVYRGPQDTEEFSLEREADGGWRVHGRRIERAAAMTYWEMDEAVERFQRILEAMGIYEAMKQAGVKQGDLVRIGENELEWHD